MVLMVGCAKAEEATAETVEESQPVNETDAEEVDEEDGNFISVESLQKALESEDLILFDARGKETYDGGHIAGALAISWQELSSMTADFATPTWGSVVDPLALEKTIVSLGIDGSKPVDIQVADEYAAHHLIGAVETNAFPVKTDKEKLLLTDVIKKAKTKGIL